MWAIQTVEVRAGEDWSHLMMLSIPYPVSHHTVYHSSEELATEVCIMNSYFEIITQVIKSYQ